MNTTELVGYFLVMPLFTVLIFICAYVIPSIGRSTSMKFREWLAAPKTITALRQDAANWQASYETAKALKIEAKASFDQQCDYVTKLQNSHDDESRGRQTAERALTQLRQEHKATVDIAELSIGRWMRSNEQLKLKLQTSEDQVALRVRLIDGLIIERDDAQRALYVSQQQAGRDAARVAELTHLLSASASERELALEEEISAQSREWTKDIERLHEELATRDRRIEEQSQGIWSLQGRLAAVPKRGSNGQFLKKVSK